MCELGTRADTLTARIMNCDWNLTIYHSTRKGMLVKLREKKSLIDYAWIFSMRKNIQLKRKFQNIEEKMDL